MDVSPETVFEAVERLCSSNQFARSHRLARFLRFTISEALAGKQDTLTEHVIERVLPQIEGLKGEGLLAAQGLQVPLFDGARIVRDEGVDADNRVTIADEPFAQVRSDKTRSTRDQNTLHRSS